MICPKCGEEIEPVEEITSKVSIIKDAHGRMILWAEEMKKFKGKVVSKRIDKYDYYETGETKNIIMKRFDHKNKLVSERKVKHFTHGKRPEVTETYHVNNDQTARSKNPKIHSIRQ